MGLWKDIPMRRYKKPEPYSLSRTTAFNKHNVQQFFDKLKNLYQIDRKFADGSRVVNLDKTAMTTVAKPCNILAVPNWSHRYHQVRDQSVEVQFQQLPVPIHHGSRLHHL